MRVDKLRELAEKLDIANLYSEIDYSYACEREFQQAGNGGNRRIRFLKEFDIQPEATDLILRTFNQVNYFYAQRQIEVARFASPLDFLISSNRVFLYKQDKPLGLRTKEIQYGARRDVDFLDIRGRYKALLGMPNDLINESLDIWSSAIDRGQHNISVALMLMLGLIAIHPFSDANGRAARLTFFWLMHRWGIPPMFIKEGQDGEFLRTGFGLESTEHLMKEAIGYLCQNHNVIRPGDYERHTAESGREMLAAFASSMFGIASCSDESLGKSALHNLLKHYDKYGHITDGPQNFRCLE
jgi:hypothetical protein